MTGPLSIGGVQLPEPLLLAPMAGITDRHFRLMVRRIGGCGLVSMEFISSEAVTRGVKHELKKLRFAAEERPMAIQIYGRDPRRMADCAALVNELAPDICDINMGCPANKVLKGCAGAALMGDLPKAAAIIAACREQLSVPLTVKFRLGLGKGCDPINYVELGRICQDLGVAAVSLHARTATQMFTGQAEWEHIRRLKQSLSIPVIGNGDVKTPESALQLFRQTGCDGVMIGRAVLTDPWIFRRIARRLRGADDIQPTLEERRDIILTHFGWIVRDEDRSTALHKLRTYAGWYTHGIPNGRALRRMIASLATPADFIEAIERHFDQLPLTESEVA
jgi:nifR3 family TIM-barrel protein